MQILHVYKSHLSESIGGVENVVDQIARSTQKIGADNTIFTLSEKPKKDIFIFNGYKVNTVKKSFEISSNGFSLKAFSIFKKLSMDADVIHFHFPWPFADLLKFCSHINKPSVLTYHSDIIRQKVLLKFYAPLKSYFLNSVDTIVATSPNYLHSSTDLILNRDKTIVIPIGLDHFSYPKPKPFDLEYIRNTFGVRFFLFVGAFRYYKGLLFLIEAGRYVNYPIVIVGSGPIENKLKSLTLKYGVKNIFFIGQVSEEYKSALFTSCYSVIFPSNLRSEAFGVSLLEGAMFSKPLISCEIGTGTSYINVDKITGLVIPPSSPKELVSAMTFLWNHPEEAHRMGKNARIRYNQLFTSEMMAKSYLDVYRQVLKNSLNTR